MKRTGWCERNQWVQIKAIVNPKNTSIYEFIFFGNDQLAVCGAHRILLLVPFDIVRCAFVIGSIVLLCRWNVILNKSNRKNVDEKIPISGISWTQSLLISMLVDRAKEKLIFCNVVCTWSRNTISKIAAHFTWNRIELDICECWWMLM